MNTIKGGGSDWTLWTVKAYYEYFVKKTSKNNINVFLISIIQIVFWFNAFA